MSPKKKRDRLAQSVTDASFGYFAAASASYSHFAAEAIRAWADVAAPEATQPKQPKSWYQPPPPSMRKSEEFTSFPMLTNPWMAGMEANWTASPAIPSAVTIWPAAMTLMTAGVPQAVAWPLAEANCASQDISALTLESLNEAFSDFNSNSSTTTTKPNAEKPTSAGIAPERPQPKRPLAEPETETSATTDDVPSHDDLVSAPYSHIEDVADLMATWNELSKKLAQSWQPPTSKAAS